MSKTIHFEIIVGTYEEYLLGYSFSSEEKSLVQTFASHDHSSSVRCLASCGNYLASGASDDRIIIYDLKARKEHCMLTHHESTITALAFTHHHSHVISAAQDGSLAIVRVGNWQLEKLWSKAHKEGTVLDISLHSTGKLALTLGSDGTIHTWNLVKGRVAYIINLKTKCEDPKSLERILFAPDDVKFVIYGGKYTEVWSIEVGGVLKVVRHDQKVTCCVWLDDEELFVGYEDGSIGIVDWDHEKKKMKPGHDGRIKAAQYFEGYIVTASSTGEIKIWTRKLKEVCKVSTGCRITCLNIAKWAGKVKKEEPKAIVDVEDAPVKKPIKSTVVVEVDESSEEENERVVEKIGKKRKKKQKDFQPVKLKKNKSIKEDIDSNENVMKKKSNKKKQTKKVNTANASENKLKKRKIRKKIATID